MKRARLFAAALCSLVIASSATAELPSKDQIEKDLAGPFAATQPHLDLSHGGPMFAQLKPLLDQECKSQVNIAKPWNQDPEALVIPLVVGNDRDGVRRAAATAYGLAVVAQYIDSGNNGDPNGISQADAKKAAIRLLRYVVESHSSGGKTDLSGKPWKDQWQSAHWAAAGARTAWLLWDDLDPEMKWLAADMITHEADRFVDRDPDHEVVGDTKAEENAWNCESDAIAFNMFPNHPRHAKWGEAANRWEISAYMTSADTTRTDIIDGKPVNEWFHYPNIYDDYTLENHDRVHPDYMTAVTLNIFQKMSYDFAGNPTPAAVTFNSNKVYASLKWLAFPDGGWVYPNGQDWHMHRNPDWINIHVAMAVLFNDPQAARLAQIDIDTAQKMIARAPENGVMQPGETAFDASQSFIIEGGSNSFLMMGMHGEGPAPVDESQLFKDLVGSRVFKYGKFAVMRTDHSVSTFSWGAQVMGMVLPMRKDLLCTPNPTGMIGEFAIPGRTPEHPVAKQVEVMDIPDTIAVAGILDRGKGAAEQRFAFCALPDGRTVYVDSVELGKTPPRSIQLGSLGILNEKNWVYHDGKRTLSYEGGQTVLEAANQLTDKPLKLSSPWYNIDGLGIAVLSSSGQQFYQPKSMASKRICRLEQMFYLNYNSKPTNLKPTVLVFYPDQPADQTKSAASDLKLDSADSKHFTITLEDGKHITADLDQLKVTIQ